MEQEPKTAGVGLAVSGRKTERNALEDFWMEKVASLEHQYDDHLRFLQARLFDHNVDRKLVARLREDNRYLKLELDAVQKQKKTLTSSLKAAGEKQRAAKRQVGTVKQRLAAALQAKDELTRTLNRTSKELRDSEKRQQALSRRLSNMQEDKTDLQRGIQGLKSRFVQMQTEKDEQDRTRKGFAYALSEIDIERRVQTKANLRLLGKVEELVRGHATKEEQLYEMQTEINRVMRDLEAERQAGAALRRQHALTQARLRDAGDEAEAARAIAESQARATQHWREELEIARTANERNGRGGPHESTQLRGQMAALELKIRRIEQKIGNVEAERSRLSKQLEILPNLQKTLEQMTRANKQRRQQLMTPAAVPDEILDLDPFLYYAKLREKHAVEEAAARPRIHPKARDRGSSGGVAGGLQLQYPHLSYEKEIAKLQAQIKALDAQVRDAQRKENRMRVELEQKKSLQQELFWREKAMLAIEKDRARMNNVAIKCAQQIGDRVGRGLPLNLLLGVGSPGVGDSDIQTTLQGHIQAQQERIEMLRRKSSLPKLVDLDKELKGLQMSQLLRMDDSQLQRNIEALRTETNDLSRRAEIVKKVRGRIEPAGEAVVQEGSGAKSEGSGAAEKDVIEEHFIPEEELLATISKQFGAEAMHRKLQEGLGSSSESGTSTASSSRSGSGKADGTRGGSHGSSVKEAVFGRRPSSEEKEEQKEAEGEVDWEPEEPDIKASVPSKSTSKEPSVVSSTASTSTAMESAAKNTATEGQSLKQSSQEERRPSVGVTGQSTTASKIVREEEENQTQDSEVEEDEAADAGDEDEGENRDEEAEG